MQNDFDVQLVLEKPLMLHLATVCEKGPRDSPLWFLYEDEKIWLFGTNKDSFIKRLKDDERAALSVVDFRVQKGVLRHVGIRGAANISAVNDQRLKRFVGKYLGSDANSWNPWFVKNIVDPIDVMVAITPESIVAKDVSFFLTGPDLASEN